MLINSAVFGPIEVEQNEIFDIPDGLLGFEGTHRYALITRQDGDATLRWLQAVDGRVPCFVVFSPDDIVDGYRPKVEESDLRALDCKSPHELHFLVIAVVPEDVTRTTVNLKSPIALNFRTGKARQVILANKDYPIRFSLADEGEQSQSS